MNDQTLSHTTVTQYEALEPQCHNTLTSEELLQLHSGGKAPRDPYEPQVLHNAVVLDQELLCHVADSVQQGASQAEQVSHHRV